MAAGPIWTAPRVEEWRKTGVKPARVMIWTVEQTIAFLNACRGHRYAAVYHVMAITGMRRGEAAGLHWRDVDLERGELAVTCQLAQIGWRTEITYPKTGHSLRQIALEPALVELLQAHKATQERRRIEAGDEWRETGLVFTRCDGTAIHPAQLTTEFYKLVARHELPPVRLHDLRHGTATHALTAGIDVKLVQDLLGHATSTFTRDVYTGVADQARREAARTLTAIFTTHDRENNDTQTRTEPRNGNGSAPTPPQPR
jgi:integrase